MMLGFSHRPAFSSGVFARNY